ADLPRRHVLFGERAAAALAEDRAVQSGRLSHQRLPLELLRGLRCEPRRQPRHDALLPGDLPRHRVVDLPHRLQAEEVGPRRLYASPSPGGGGSTRSARSSRSVGVGWLFLSKEVTPPRLASSMLADPPPPGEGEDASPE